MNSLVLSHMDYTCSPLHLEIGKGGPILFYPPNQINEIEEVLGVDIHVFGANQSAGYAQYTTIYISRYAVYCIENDLNNLEISAFVFCNYWA